jgi:outer membrane protein assembly factor BamB
VTAQTTSTDWPQLQHDEQRTGRTTATMTPSTRARWIWFGPNNILRNKDTKPGVATWEDDLRSYDGHNLEMPTSVPFTFAETMQPIIVNGKVFVADTTMQKVWAISQDDGSTLWQGDNPGGAIWPGVATATRVVFTSLKGYITGWDANSGTQLWRVDTGRTIHSAPALSGSTVIVTSENGNVYSINIDTGVINWQRDTGAPITAAPTVFQNRVYVGNEAMYAIALDFATGRELARTKIMGQSFRGLWIVGVGDRVIYHTVPFPYIGSEYAYDGVIDANTGSFQNEQTIVRNKLNGDWKNWEHIFALKYDTLSKDYTIALGPVSGVGTPPDPVVLSQTNQPITWWPTYFGTISTCGFGCRSGMEIDLSSFDINTGNGVQLPGNGNFITRVETDNTFGLTMGGNILYLRQNFRGTKAVDLKNLTSFTISAVYRYRDGGGWAAPLNFAQGSQTSPFPAGTVTVPTTGPVLGESHVGPAIVPNQILFTEDFALVCMEHF